MFSSVSKIYRYWNQTKKVIFMILRTRGHRYDGNGNHHQLKWYGSHVSEKPQWAKKMRRYFRKNPNFMTLAKGIFLSLTETVRHYDMYLDNKLPKFMLPICIVIHLAHVLQITIRKPGGEQLNVMRTHHLSTSPPTYPFALVDKYYWKLICKWCKLIFYRFFILR